MIYLNDIFINTTIFPDFTSQVWKLDENLLKSAFKVTWEFSNESEFIQLAQLKDLLDNYNKKDITLFIKYLPYGRQDKEVSNSATFALRTFAKLLNTLNFSKVLIMDPHSQVALDLINNSSATYPINNLLKVQRLTETNLFCYPDKGATVRYADLYDYSHIYGEKVRDQLSGQILKYDLVGDPKDRTVLIVDDICDGGMTFKLLTKDLLAAGAKEVNLFITHGLFSKGLKTLQESGINRIFTQDGEMFETHDLGLVFRSLN